MASRLTRILEGNRGGEWRGGRRSWCTKREKSDGVEQAAQTDVRYLGQTRLERREIGYIYGCGREVVMNKSLGNHQVWTVWHFIDALHICLPFSLSFILIYWSPAFHLEDFLYVSHFSRFLPPSSTPVIVLFFFPRYWDSVIFFLAIFCFLVMSTLSAFTCWLRMFSFSSFLIFFFAFFSLLDFISYLLISFLFFFSAVWLDLLSDLQLFREFPFSFFLVILNFFFFFVFCFSLSSFLLDIRAVFCLR